MLINSFIVGLMRFVGAVMFFGGMAMLGYAVIGGYYHYSPILHAVAWGFAGWVLFFSGMNLLGEFKPLQTYAVAQQQIPPSDDTYGKQTFATAEELMRQFGIRGKTMEDATFED